MIYNPDRWEPINCDVCGRLLCYEVSGGDVNVTSFMHAECTHEEWRKASTCVDREDNR